jgi:cellulose synthase/poly-beta-1,6-N-acetylglucosamine synthase-like glycosyltransferase
MTRRFLQAIFVLVSGSIVAAVVAAWYYGVPRLQAQDALVPITSKILVIFLVVLVLRYLILAGLAFLKHLQHAKEPMLPAGFPPISIIFPAHNEGPVIESAILSAMRLDYPQFEVIVVDDGSTDDTYAKATQIAANSSANRLRVFTQQNNGKASALNLGISQARGELILCTDGDSRLDGAALMRAAAHFYDPFVGAVAGNVKVANRLNHLTKLQSLEYIEGLNLVRSAQAYFNRVTVIPGPLGLFRKEALLEIGAYEMDTFAEDCDLTLRLLLAGWEIKYESDAIVWTEAPENISGLVLQRYRWGRGVLQAIIKNRRYLFGGCPTTGTWLTFWLFVLDGIALPAMNVISIACFLFAVLGGSLSVLIPLWWAQLTLLDAVIAILCIAAEGEQLSLVLNAVSYRLFFVPFVDMLRCLAWFDELFDVRMKWMRLERFGRI